MVPWTHPSKPKPNLSQVCPSSTVHPVLQLGTCKFSLLPFSPSPSTSNSPSSMKPRSTLYLASFHCFLCPLLPLSDNHLSTRLLHWPPKWSFHCHSCLFPTYSPPTKWWDHISLLHKTLQLLSITLRMKSQVCLWSASKAGCDLTLPTRPMAYWALAICIISYLRTYANCPLSRIVLPLFFTMTNLSVSSKFLYWSPNPQNVEIRSLQQ